MWKSKNIPRIMYFHIGCPVYKYMPSFEHKVCDIDVIPFWRNQIELPNMFNIFSLILM